MDLVPVEAILMLAFADLFIVMALSLFLGLVLARTDAVDTRKAVVLALVLPIIGPLVWTATAVLRTPAIASVRRRRTRGVGTYLTVTMLALSSALIFVASVQPWGAVVGVYDEYRLVGDAAAFDTGVGIVGTLTSAVLLGGGAVAIALFTASGRVAAAAATVGAAWLLVTADALIVFSAVNDLSQTVVGLSGGHGSAHLGPGPGLWLALLASLCAWGAAIRLVLPDRARDMAERRSADVPRPAEPASYLISRTGATGSSCRTSASPDTSYDYGDGF